MYFCFKTYTLCFQIYEKYTNNNYNIYIKRNNL